MELERVSLPAAMMRSGIKALTETDGLNYENSDNVSLIIGFSEKDRK